MAHFYHKSTIFFMKVSHFFHKSVTFRKHPIQFFCGSEKNILLRRKKFDFRILDFEGSDQKFFGFNFFAEVKKIFY